MRRPAAFEYGDRNGVYHAHVMWKARRGRSLVEWREPKCWTCRTVLDSGDGRGSGLYILFGDQHLLNRALLWTAVVASLHVAECPNADVRLTVYGALKPDSQYGPDDFLDVGWPSDDPVVQVQRIVEGPSRARRRGGWEHRRFRRRLRIPVAIPPPTRLTPKLLASLDRKHPGRP